MVYTSDRPTAKRHQTTLSQFITKKVKPNSAQDEESTQNLPVSETSQTLVADDGDDDTENKENDQTLEIDIPSDLSGKDEPRKLPPKNFKFPKTKIDKIRSFAFCHLENYDFLEYSVKQDAVYCKCCRHISKRNSPWSVFGFRDWQQFNKSVKRHLISKRHKECKVEYESYLMTKRSIVGTVKEQLCNPDVLNARILVADDEHFDLVIECLLFLTRQDIAIRGHREDSQSDNKGNFLELHEFLLFKNKRLRDVYERSNFKMLSPTVQNLVLEAAATAGIKLIQSELKTNEKYAIIADGTRNRNNEEIEAVALRYFYKGQIVERVVGFIDISRDQSAAGCAKAVEDVLQPLYLNPKCCVGFSFDGAPVMSGHKGGVQALLRKIYINAVFVHCSSHRLNLVLQKISTNCREAGECIAVCNKLYTYLTQPKHAALLKSVQKETR